MTSDTIIALRRQDRDRDFMRELELGVEDARPGSGILSTSSPDPRELPPVTPPRREDDAREDKAQPLRRYG